MSTSTNTITSALSTFWTFDPFACIVSGSYERAPRRI